MRLAFPGSWEAVMTLLKSIKRLAESDQSREDAARRGVRIASQTIRNIRSFCYEFRSRRD
jgi:flavin-binding protein dodecin